MYSIILVCSLINVGDYNHAKSLAKELMIKFPNSELVTIDTNSPNATLDITNVNDKTQRIWLFVGDKAAESLQKLSESNANFFQENKDYVYFGAHQFIENIDITSLPINHVMMPSSALSFSQKERLKSIKVKSYTFAVPNDNLSLDELSQKFYSWDDKVDITKEYIIVTLPGDAPDQNNIQHYFTNESALELLKLVQDTWEREGKKHTILIQNSPRTGKFNPDTGKIECAHEYTENPADAIDNVSKEFIKNITATGMPFKFYNFAFKLDGSKKQVESVFNQLLYLTSLEGNITIVPGESVSMLGQVTAYAKPSNIIVFEPSSLNQTHKAIIDDGFARGFYSIGYNKPSKFASNRRALNEDTREVVDSIAKNIGNNKAIKR